MPETPEIEVRATEGAAAEGDSDGAAPSQSPVKRTGLRDLFRRARWRRGWRRARLFWKALSSFILSLTAVATVVLILTLLTKELTRRALVFEPISVPKEMAENGYSPEVAARRLRDAVNVFVAQAHTSMKGPEIALRGEVPEIVVPTVGISIDSIAEAIRGFLHSSLHQRVSGEFTVTDRALSLRLRLDGRELPGSPTGSATEKPDELLAKAVPELLKEIQPYVVASNLSKKEPVQVLKIAQQTIARLPREDENVINSYLLEASIYQDRKSYAQATAAVQQALGIDPRSPTAYNSLGNVFYLQHKFDEAMAEYRRAVALDPKVAAPHGNIGNVLREEHKYDEALVEYRKGIALDPGYGALHDGLGIVLYDRKRDEEAIAEYRKAIELSPDYAKAHAHLGDLLRDQGKREESVTEYRRAIELDSTAAYAHNGLGNVLDDKHEYAEAMAEYRRAIELDAKDPTFHSNLGKCPTRATRGRTSGYRIPQSHRARPDGGERP